ncbi:MAG: HXXEE domain-containing protein [Pseudomonadota bacterium]
MNSRTLVLPCIALAFALLWAPLGQHGFLVEHWMKVGAFMAPFVLLATFAARDFGSRAFYRDPQVLAALLLAAYIAHQVEEHWIDLTGAHYAFYSYVNALLSEVTRAPEGTEWLSPAAIFVINTSLVWLVGALAIALAHRRSFPLLCMAAITLVNALSHVAAGLAKASYNPGLATSVLIFLPLALFVYHAERKAGIGLIALSVVWAVLAHIVMVGGLVALRFTQVFTEPVYFAALVALSLLPALPVGNGRDALMAPSND